MSNQVRDILLYNMITHYNAWELMKVANYEEDVIKICCLFFTLFFAQPFLISTSVVKFHYLRHSTLHFLMGTLQPANSLSSTIMPLQHFRKQICIIIRLTPISVSLDYNTRSREDLSYHFFLPKKKNGVVLEFMTTFYHFDFPYRRYNYKKYTNF